MSETNEYVYGYCALLMVIADRAFSAGTFLLAVGLSLIFFQYAFTASYEIDLVILDMPITPVAAIMAAAGAILVVMALRSR